MSRLAELVLGLSMETKTAAEMASLSPEAALHRIVDTEFALDEESAVIAVLCHALSRSEAPLSREIIRQAARWLWPRPAQLGIVTIELDRTDDGWRAVNLLERIVDEAPEHVSVAINGAIVLAPEKYAPMILRIARDPRPEIRERLYTILGRGQSLVPPGSLKWRDLTVGDMTELLRLGIRDAAAAVRARAIAVGYGYGAVNLVLEDIVEAVRDPELEVRRYALVALGLASDVATRSILLARLEHGDQAEAASAIWALARRNDGIASVLALIGDGRPWVLSEVLGAIKEVSVPLTDEELAALATWANVPDEMPAILNRHVDRTRRGAPERGPDETSWSVVRR